MKAALVGLAALACQAPAIESTRHELVMDVAIDGHRLPYLLRVPSVAPPASAIGL